MSSIMAKVGRGAAKKLIKKLVMKRQGKAASGYHENQGATSRPCRDHVHAGGRLRI